jgi:hypothetical protein
LMREGVITTRSIRFSQGALKSPKIFSGFDKANSTTETEEGR